MSNNEVLTPRPTASVRRRRPILRPAVALVVMALALGTSVTPIFADPPTAPDAAEHRRCDPRAQRGDGRLHANSDGGDAITGYTVTCDSSDGGTTQTATDTASPITVSALTNGSTYACTVSRPTRSATARLPTRPTTSSPSTIPDAPTITGVTRGSNSAIVAFTPNSDGGDEIVFYKATCTSSTGGTTRSKTGVSSPLTVVSLSNGRTYTCVGRCDELDREQCGIGRVELLRRRHDSDSATAWNISMARRTSSSSRTGSRP